MNEAASELAAKLENRTAKVGVVGLGYVGLPLAVEFAKAGFEVVGLDVDRNKVRAVNAAETYIQDISSNELGAVVKSGKLRASEDFGELAKVDAVSICVPTPLRKTKDPDISYIVNATNEIAKHVRRGQLVVLESTTYPGTTVEVIVPRLTRSKLRVGEDVFVAFSPERVDPGNPTYKTHNTPKVVGGVTPACTEVARKLYESVIEKVVVVSSAATAEMVKLLENTFRSVNIGLVNEIAIMCDKLGLDVWEVIDAAATKPFGFMPFYPGPGLGGHCIPIDPHYLSWKLRTLNYKARFIELASEVNGEMPHFVLGRVVDTLNRVKKSVNGSKVLLLGVAYKRNTSDVRESPALDILNLLHLRGANVVFHDPFVKTVRLDSITLDSQPLTSELLRSSDCVVIVTDHSAFDYRFVVEHARAIIDTRNAAKGVDAPSKIVKL
jgi:UDP-N-acetyl-D-glucosamine dehydrogenase